MKTPPFSIDSEMLALCAAIERLLGFLSGLTAIKPEPKLRRQNRIRTIKDTLAIEGNTLTIDQVTAILEGRRVLGPKNEVIEVQNAMKLYSELNQFNPRSERDFKKVHRLLMEDLLPSAGKYRAGGVGVLKGSIVSHIAPPARLVPKLIQDLFNYLKKEKKLHPLVVASIAHYEIEFIHPFEDGNGRMGRFWQSLLLTRYHPVFEYLPIESVIRDKQADYYEKLEKSDKSGSLNPFILFSLDVIRAALEDFSKDYRSKPQDQNERLKIAKAHFASKKFSRSEYLKLFKTISTATASRDLASGVDQEKLHKQGDRRNTVYFFMSL